MKIFLLFLVNIFFLFLQIASFDTISLFSYKIKFSYILCLSIVFSIKNRNIYTSVLFALLSGLLIDMYNNQISFYFLTLIIVSIIINKLSNNISFSILYLFVIISFSTFFIEIINGSLIGLFYYSTDGDLISFQIFKDNIIPYIIGNNIIGYIFNLLFKDNKSN